MPRCQICSCICDPGDLRNGVCDDCREEGRKEQEREQIMDRLARADFRQIRLEDLNYESI